MTWPPGPSGTSPSRQSPAALGGKVAGQAYNEAIRDQTGALRELRAELKDLRGAIRDMKKVPGQMHDAVWAGAEKGTERGAERGSEKGTRKGQDGKNQSLATKVRTNGRPLATRG